MRQKAVLLALLAVAGVSALSGCGGDGGGAAATGTFVGRVDGTDALIALVTNGEELEAYVCDGKEGGISRWLESEAAGEEPVVLLARDGRPLGEASFRGEQTSGRVTLDFQEHTFTAVFVPDEAEAGLYREAKGTPGFAGFEETGWIVLPDGTEVGTHGLVDSVMDIATSPAPKRTSQTKLVDPIVND